MLHVSEVAEGFELKVWIERNDKVLAGILLLKPNLHNINSRVLVGLPQRRPAAREHVPGAGAVELPEPAERWQVFALCGSARHVMIK